MFTGIVEHTAQVVRFEKNTQGVYLTLEKPEQWDIKLGDSVAVSGACLTVVEQNEKTFSFDIMPETLQKTIFGTGDMSRVNLEQAITLGARLDGHMVSGHVDTVGTVEHVDNQNGTYAIQISFGIQYASLVIMKGSIVIDGVSLTVTEIGDNWCKINLVPYTLKHTTLDTLKEGDRVNLEFDMVGKYINRFMQIHHAGK